MVVDLTRFANKLFKYYIKHLLCINQLDQIDRLLDSSLSTFNTSELQSENKMKERLIQVVSDSES